MSRCSTWFPIGGLREPNIYQNLVCFTMCGKYPEKFTSNISCTGNSILGFLIFPHIRKLCGNTKIIRRVFADKLVVYSYYQNFLTLSTSSNQHLVCSTLYLSMRLWKSLDKVVLVLNAVSLYAY